MAEVGRPLELLDRPGGHLRQLAMAMGSAAFEKLREKAAAAAAAGVVVDDTRLK